MAALVEHRQHRQFGSRIRVRQAAADRPLVADRQMRDVAHGCRNYRQVGCDQRRVLELAMSRHRADRHTGATQFDERQVLDAVQIDQHRGPRHPEVQQRQQTLASGEDFSLAVGFRERFHRGAHRHWSDIFKLGRLHRVRPSRPVSFPTWPFIIRREIAEAFFLRRPAALP